MAEIKKIKNIFKNNNDVSMKKDFTQKWIEMINNQEKNKVHHLNINPKS